MAGKSGAVLALGATLVMAVGLAGCKKEGVQATNESAESVAKKVASSNIKPKPGQWHSTVKIDEMKMPNLPPEAKAMLDQRIGKPQSFTSCLTPEQAAKPDASFFQKGAQGCTYEHFSMEGGKIDAKMTCARSGQKQTMVMDGTYSPESYDIKIATEGEAQPGMPVTMKMSIASKRIGECTGKETK